jgi:uroporphyrinogen decarboxylase
MRGKFLMNSKKRVLHAFGKKEGLPDRVPIQFDLCRQLIDSFGKDLGIKPHYSNSYYEDLTYRISANEIRTKLGSDVVVVGGTVADGFVPNVIRDNITSNEFGMHMKPTELYVEVVKPPLNEVETVEQIKAYDFPDPYAKGRFDDAKRNIDKYGKDYFIIGDVELSIFELAWQLTGLEKYMIDMTYEEEWVEALNDRVEQWTEGLSIQLAKAGVDALWFGEDLGSQTSILISPDIWRKMFKPRYIRLFEKIRKINPDIMIIMHSDGAVAPLINDFIEMGIDVYNPVQPNVPGSDPQELKDKYGGRIYFFGGIDQQNLLPEGNVEKIRQEIKYRAEVLGRSGGYLLAPAHIIQADVSKETVLEMIKTAKDYGKYDKK